MRKSRLILNALTIAALTLAAASLAQAQATRTWVSGVGDDVNPCSRTAPCKTFAGAISKTFIGGEIDALDPGGFGAITTTKSITIDGASGFGSILASGTTGVTINLQQSLANDPERRVVLRRLSINGTGASGAAGVRTGIRGVSIVQGNLTNDLRVSIENCYIQNFSQEGVNANVNSSSFVSLKDTNITNCNVGVNFTSASGFLVGNLDRVRIEKMTSNGVVYGTNSFGNVRDTASNSNGGDGISMAAGNTSGRVNIESSVTNNNGTGVRSGGAGSKLIISNTSIQSNGTGAATGGGGLESHGNNQISNNGAPGSAFTPLGPQ
jgi:hypothetical protein